MSSPKPVLFNCAKCRMNFDNKEKLANHINQFCTDSIYGQNPEQLLKQLKLDLQNSSSSHLTFTEIKQYLHQTGDISQMTINSTAKMSLNDLRQKFETQGMDEDMEQLKQEVNISYVINK